MAKVKQLEFTPGEWYADGDCVGSLDDREELVGDVVCMAPTEFENSMEYWSANVRLLAQAKRMYEILDSLSSEDISWDEWAAPINIGQDIRGVLEAINGHP